MVNVFGTKYICKYKKIGKKYKKHYVCMYKTYLLFTDDFCCDDKIAIIIKPPDQMSEKNAHCKVNLNDLRWKNIVRCATVYNTYYFASILIRICKCSTYFSIFLR